MCPCERGGEEERESRSDMDPMRVKMRKARDVKRGNGGVHLPAYISVRFQYFPYVLKVSGKCQQWPLGSDLLQLSRQNQSCFIHTGVPLYNDNSIPCKRS